MACSGRAGWRPTRDGHGGTTHSIRADCAICQNVPAQTTPARFARFRWLRLLVTITFPCFYCGNSARAAVGGKGAGAVTDPDIL